MRLIILVISIVTGLGASALAQSNKAKEYNYRAMVDGCVESQRAYDVRTCVGYVEELSTHMLHIYAMNRAMHFATRGDAANVDDYSVAARGALISAIIAVRSLEEFYPKAWDKKDDPAKLLQ